jgi:hypothetical protein
MPRSLCAIPERLAMLHSALAAAVCLLALVADGGLRADQRLLGGTSNEAGREANARNAALLVKAYPDYLDRVEGNDLVWKDGSRMKIDEGQSKSDFDALLNSGDIKDQFYATYPVGRNGLSPTENFDPGRVRNRAFFSKMYGDCQKGEVTKKLVAIAWLPAHGGQKLLVTKVNDVAARLEAVSAELDRLPQHFLKYLKPSSGTYNCRVIARTKRASPHGLGIAIDINAPQTDYWQWNKPGSGGILAYKNHVPWEIVEIFEKHGFIWGGKWYHYDAMHFEYRPEIIAAGK